MKAILDNENLKPNDRLIQYNRCPQKYLFLIRQGDGHAPPVTVPNVKIQPMPNSPPPTPTPFNPFTPPAPVVTPVPSTSSVISTPTCSSNRINLPRVTPKEQRLRQERRKNSRYKAFFVNWNGLDETELYEE